MFYFLYLDVCRGRLILLLKKFIFSSLTTKVIHRRNKLQDTTIKYKSEFRQLQQKEPRLWLL